MTKREEVPVTPPEGEASTPDDSAEVKPPVEKPLDPKEAAYQRSKDDLARKRRTLFRKHGKF